MKISKILAGMSAMALAASMMTIGASAAITGAGDDGNMIYDIKTLIEANNIKISDVYGVRAYFSDSAAGVVEQGAGGGFIFSSKSNNWNQKQWCNGCGESETHDIQYDAATKSITRLEETPFWTDVDVSDAEGEYAQVAFSEWWGGDIDFTKIVLLDKDGKEIEGSDVNPGGNSVDLSEYKKQTEVTLNGEGRSVTDSGKVRINIKHPWCDDAHKADFNLVDDWSVFAGADAIAVTVDISNVTDAFTAYPCFTNGIENGIGYWEASDNNPAVTVNADGTYTFIVKFPSALEMDANNMFFDIATDLAGTDDEDPAVKMAVKKVVVLNKSEAEPTDPSESTADSTDSTDSDESKVILADSVDSKTNSAATSSKAANNASNTNPSTGAAALAAVGVALAGAAVVATKKRK
ncbi:NPXTG-anchored protein [Ruminococcus bicirculans (ex Wegman et al. 2014)]|uniref:NPXTG-anchored protein n=1 Tax=Ruminococcus bicirculans (ex Wegman et al. 2014) TaxID=1160721 RepID=UPI00366F4789